MHLAQSSCAVEGDTLPEIIYQSPSVTKNGHEDRIDARGYFAKMYQNVLQHSSHTWWSHQIEIEVPASSILTLTLTAQADGIRSVLFTRAG